MTVRQGWILFGFAILCAVAVQARAVPPGMPAVDRATRETDRAVRQKVEKQLIEMPREGVAAGGDVINVQQVPEKGGEVVKK